MYGFYYDFSFPFPFQKDFLPLIEEKMKGLIKQEPEMRQIEMVPSNAADFLAHRGQPKRAEAARQSHDPLVQLIQIGEFVDLVPGAVSDELHEIKALKLYDFRETGKNQVRIFGAAFPDKEQLKNCLKNKKLFNWKSHRELGHQLFSQVEEGRWIWLPKGEAMRRQWVGLWEEECRAQNFSFIRTAGSDSGLDDVILAHKNYFTSSPPSATRLAECSYLRGEEELFEGMFTTKSYFADVASRACQPEEMLKECIYSLQFMRKILKIMSFDFLWVLRPASKGRGENRGNGVLNQALKECDIDPFIDDEWPDGPKLEVHIPDAMGRLWPGPFCRVDGSVITHSVFGSMERCLALWLEQNQG